MKKNNIITSAIILIITLLVPGQILPQSGFTLSGRVTDRAKRPAAGAQVFVQEAKLSARAGNDGYYSISLPKQGVYTVFVYTTGMKIIKANVEVKADTTRDFALSREDTGAGEVVVMGERDIQKLSRQTMKAHEMKEVPASFGDSLGAITSLPGIIRTNVLFGAMVIRGANPMLNNYYIDDIPIYNPMHYGGLHSIINTNLMSEIDIYSSSFPACFGSSLAAVINITTIDNINEFGGYFDVSLLSSNVIVMMPIQRGNPDTIVNLESPDDAANKKENTGYIIASGRYGYLSLIVPLLVNKDEIEVVPEYWDYQFKYKYLFNKKHSITLLVMGSRDYMKILKKKKMESGEDPYLAKLQFKIDQYSNNQGLYYAYQPSRGFDNKVIVYSSLRKSYEYLNVDNENAATWAKDIHIDSRPYIIGLKDKVRFEWWRRHAEVRAGFEYTMYYFQVKGRTILPQGIKDGFDPTKPDSFKIYDLDDKIVNHTLSGYIENKFTAEGLTFVPGIRSDYLKRAGSSTIDPRAMLSYEFPSETIISAAGGKYSYFFQVNPFYFDSNPDIAKINLEHGLKSEKAIHRAAGIEQRIDLFSIKLEGFYNNFYDLAEPYPHTEPDGTEMQGLSSGKARARGIEILLKKNKRENQDGLFSWISYTFTRSKFKSGLPNYDGYAGVTGNMAGDKYGDTWVNYDFEQRHSVKLTSGYTYGNHTFSGRFQFYSSFPYTPIINSVEDINYTGRYIPVYGARNSRHFPAQHSLDLRYSYQINKSWGYIKWYFEIINVYNNRPIDRQRWRWDRPYGDDNPNTSKNRGDSGLGVMPNFGVEVKF